LACKINKMWQIGKVYEIDDDQCLFQGCWLFSITDLNL
jgi:hypothetical protein